MALTPQQQQFLDAYVLKHSLKGKGKRKRADSFSALRQQVAHALTGLPQSLAASLQGDMDAADALGEALKFDRASDAMTQLLAKIQAAALAHDPKADIARLKNLVDDALRGANNLDSNLPHTQAFLADDQAGTLQPRCRPIVEATDLPDPAKVGDTAWVRAAQALIQTRASDLTVLARKMMLGKSGAQQIKSSMDGLNQAIQVANNAAVDTLKGCNTRVQREQVAQEVARMRQGLLETPKYALLRRGQRFDAAALGAQVDDIYDDLAPKLDPVKLQLESLRRRVETVLARLRPDDTQQGDGKHGGNALLTAEQMQDRLLGVPQLALGAPARGKPKTFDQAAVYSRVGASSIGDSPNDVPPDDPRFKEILTVSRNLLKRQIADLNLKPGSDEIFDLTMLTADDFAQTYAKTQGWDLAKLTPGQRSLMAAVGAGMAEHAVTLCENKLDLNAKTMNLGGQRYGKPKLLAKGGVGAVYRYESETHPGQFIVLKSLLDEDPEARASMVQEIRGHRHLMQGQGDKSAQGSKNIVSMEGAVIGSDGSLHMALEMVSGGDLEDNRHALDMASEVGAIPEEVRNIVNQSRLKQAVQGLAYMREQNLVHFDIKGANFMIAEDGTVKVADFGSSGLGADDTGKRKQEEGNIATAGYAPSVRANEEVDSSFDAYALGKLMETMHMRGSTPQTRDAGQVGHKPLTGALGRVVEGLTEADASDRSSFGAVLKSSYMQELDNYDPEVLKQVSVASIAYGKAVKAEAKDVVKGLPDAVIDKAAQRSRVARDAVGFADVMGAIRVILEDCRIEIARLRVTLSKATDDIARHETSTKLEDAQRKVVEHEGYLARFGQSPEAKKLAAELRQLSEQLLRPKDAPDDKKKADLLALLNDAVETPGEFCALVALNSNAAIFGSWGVHPEHLQKLASLYSANISPRNPKALDLLKDGLQSVQEVMNTVTDKAAKTALTKGFTNMLKKLSAEYRAALEEQKAELAKTA